MSERVLIVEDEDVLRTNLVEFLTEEGYEVDEARDGVEGLEHVRREDYGVVVTDMRMPRMDGMTLLHHVVAERPETQVLLTTAYASVDSAVEALRLGAYDYLIKPVLFEDLLQKLRNLHSFRELKEEVTRLRRRLHGPAETSGIVGESEALRRVLEMVEMVAPTNTTVLITGESGTGKELIARAVHRRSNQPDAEFVPVNVAAMPDTLVESHLFGHERGAFTGADRRRPGILRSARGGTVFLDELGELPMAAQAKLLRALESGEVRPVGADRAVQASFRLVAATNQRLEEMVQAGTFRADLFYRLNVFRIELPPLREQQADIPPLVEHFLRHHGEKLRKPAARVSNEGMRLLMGYAWPGNVRELSNVLERALILARDGRIGIEQLPRELQDAPVQPITLREAVEEAEKRHIVATLSACDGNREAAARILGIDRATLYRRLDRYEIS